MFPANLDHLRVEWMKRGSYKTAWVTPGHDCCVHANMDMEQQSDHKLITPSGMGLLVCGAGSRPSCHLVCQEGGANWCEPEPDAGPGSFIRWHSDNEPLFGPLNSLKLIVSLSLGNSVEFMVRRPAGQFSLFDSAGPW